MLRIPKHTLIGFGVHLLQGKAVPAHKAAYLAESAVFAEACGLHTHGVAAFAHWDKYVGETIDPAAEPEVVRQMPGTALLDGRRGFGHWAAKRARDLALEKARNQGIAMVAVRNTSWLGALGPHILPIAQDGLFAQLWAQTSNCRDCAPWGGADGVFSTNPLALAFPTGERPMVSDFSSAAISYGRTKALIRGGQRAPENLYLDREGCPTDDPGVIEDGGTILFTGGQHSGYRGYALALWAEATALLAGAAHRTPDERLAQSFNLTVIDPPAFAGADAYRAEMRRLLDEIRRSRLRPGFEVIRLPGERAQQAAEQAQTHGVPVPEKLVERLNETADANGLPRLP
jgi:L-lactate dehydrogenase